MTFRAVATLLIAAVLVAASGCPQAKPEAYASDYYHDRSANFPLNDEERKIILAVKETLREKGIDVPEVDHLLVGAARNVALKVIAMAEKDKRGRLNNETIQQALLDVGITDSRISTHVVSGGVWHDLAEGLTGAFGKAFTGAAMTHFGVGVVEHGFPAERVAVVLFTKRMVELELFPRFVDDANGVSLQGRVLPGYKKTSVLITKPNGEIVTIQPVIDKDRDFLLPLPIDPEQKGRYTVEVEVEADAGPEISALFPVDYKVKALKQTFVASSAAVRSGADQRIAETEPVYSERDAELLLIDLINKERKQRNLIPLIENEGLREMARTHAIDMKREGFAGHVSPGEGDLAVRAEKAGVQYLQIGENIALSPSIRTAHRNLMASPAHRANVVDAKYRYIGVGVKREVDRDGHVQYWIAQEFADLR